MCIPDVTDETIEYWEDNNFLINNELELWCACANHRIISCVQINHLKNVCFVFVGNLEFFTQFFYVRLKVDLNIECSVLIMRENLNWYSLSLEMTFNLIGINTLLFL